MIHSLALFFNVALLSTANRVHQKYQHEARASEFLFLELALMDG
jgi:hypothetical protein